jgi:pimeloyl-ACP methyl ester carboxylesterase
MTTFAMIHGASDSGWYWHLVAAQLRSRGYDVVAPNLPCGDESAGLLDYTDTVVDAIGDRTDDLIVVGQSFGAYTAPLVATRVPVRKLVLVTGMIPAPGEPGAEWGTNTGYAQAVREQAARDGGKTGSDDVFVAFLHDVPRTLAEEALSRGQGEKSRALSEPWPLDAWPDVPTHFVLCSADRFFPPDFMRKLVAERLGVTPDEIAASHCVALSRPNELAEMLHGYATS